MLYQTARLCTVKVAQLCPTLCDPMDCIVPAILQAKILQWVAFPFSRGSSQPRDHTQVFALQLEPQGKPKNTGVGRLSIPSLADLPDPGIYNLVRNIRASLVDQVIKNPPANARDAGSIPELGRSPGEGKGYSLQYSGLENSVDCIVHGVTKVRHD